MSKTEFMNIKIDNLYMNEALEEIEKEIKKRKTYVVTPNVDHIVRLQYDDLFLKIYNNADLVFADGKPILWISRLYNRPIKEKISGSDLFPRICGLAANKGYSLFFLGGRKGVAKIAAENLKRKYDGLNICGIYSPTYGFEKSKEEINIIIDLINHAKPDILIVGLGSPKQEKFIFENLAQMDVGISLGLGASLDFEAGAIRRAPKWMSDMGLEWLFRITQDPGRLANRYWYDAIHIIPLIVKYWNKK